MFIQKDDYMKGDVDFGLSTDAVVVDNLEKELFFAAKVVVKIYRDSFNGCEKELLMVFQSSFLSSNEYSKHL